MNQFSEKYLKQLADQKKLLAWLIDPDKYEDERWNDSYRTYEKISDIILVGGSLIFKGVVSEVCKKIKLKTAKPVILFPGNSMQVCGEADAILFLSLVSGRNPEYLINQQVMAAPEIKRHKLEVLPTAYLIISSQNMTTAHYISQTLPIPADKPEIAAVTSLAARYLGMRHFYLDAGSGSAKPVSEEMIATVKKEIADHLLWIGGGIKSAEDIIKAWRAGADVVVVGSMFENNLELNHHISLIMNFQER